MEEIKYIAEQWLKTYAYTIATNNLDAHLDLVSPQLQVMGISRAGFLDYNEWAKRRRNDLAKHRLLRASHHNLVMGHSTPGRLRFTVEETLKSTQGESYVLRKDVVLQLEPDGKWREVEEFVHNVRQLPSNDNGAHPT